MKKIHLIIILFCVAISIQAQKQTTQFAIKSGYIKYDLTGNTTGTKELWWDNYGEKTRQEEKTKTVTKVFGIKSESETHILTVNNKDVTYSVDYISKNNTKNTNGYYEGKSFSESMTEAEQKQFEEDILNSLGGERLGTRMFMNKKCELISVLGTKSWIYKGAVLKSEANIMGVSVNTTAVEFKPNIKVEASKFEQPTGVKFKDNYVNQQEGGLFGAMAQAMQEADKEMMKETQQYDDEQDKPKEIIPTKYPYEKFIQKINNFKYNGFTKTMNMRPEGTYFAVFMKGLTNSISVIISSKKNADKHFSSEFKTFTHKGKNCYYGIVEDEEEGMYSEMIIIDIKYDSFAIISLSPQKGKEELIKIVDAFNF